MLIVVTITSCSPYKPKNSLPDITLVQGYTISREQIIYQFVEKFGFTDICFHNRSYFIVNNFQLSSDWKELPFSIPDFERVNSMRNKIDKVSMDSLSIIFEPKNFFSDISLDMREFKKDINFPQKKYLGNGYYRVNDNSFEVYFNDSKSVYYEFHKCDE